MKQHYSVDTGSIKQLTDKQEPNLIKDSIAELTETCCQIKATKESKITLLHDLLMSAARYFYWIVVWELLFKSYLATK